MPRTAAATVTESTSTRILDIAERLIQTRGYNGFSYSDVANALDITKASLHYHFATKEKLGATLIDRYIAIFQKALAGIAKKEVTAIGALRAYAGLYGDALRGGRMCLCGMLAAEYETLPGSMQGRLRKFFDTNEAWIAGVLEGGRRNRTLAFEGSPRDGARALISGLEGAMLLARPYRDDARFAAAADRLLKSFRD